MAATAPPEIQVYALFPHTVALVGNLDIRPSNWHWVHCLTFPVEQLNALQFSHKPYKWICYAIGVIVGAEGHLSSCSDLLDVVDYDAALPAESTTLYYHTSEEEKQRMFPLDPDIGRTRITSSVTTVRRTLFHDDVVERDRKCVMTGMYLTACDAVHLLAHSKGDKYIADYTQRRSRDPTGGDIIEEIDSARNGLLLHTVTHRALGTNIAFLPTPNFVMTTADVHPNAVSSDKACTTHLFLLGDEDRALLGDRSLPLGSPLQISDSPEWPPAILFDAVYAGAVLHHFGTKTLIDQITATWKGIHHPGGAMTAGQAEQKAIEDKKAADPQKVQKQAQERGARYQARTVPAPDYFDMLMTLPYIRVPQNELEAVFREAEEKAEEMMQTCSREKVDTWLKQSAVV